MTTPIQKVGVLGWGGGGAGIAAHVANAGIPVVLLDIVKEGAPERSALNDVKSSRSALDDVKSSRSALAIEALGRLVKTKPAPLMAAARAKLITPGNLEDDLALLADCDWIIEAVIERVDIKQKVYRAVDGVRKAGSIVSSNTSTIP